jgi:serine/threonine protein kinase
MWLPSANAFTVIDFGSAAPTGQEAYISCSLTYVAPEAVLAYSKGETRMIVTGALDVWSLGVVFYEFLKSSRMLLCSRDDVFAAAAGKVPFRWEERGTPQHAADMRRLGLLWTLIMAMLKRDPAARITMHCNY